MRRQVSLPAAGEPGASLPRIRLQVRDAGAQSRRPKGPIGPLREPLRLSAAGPVITRMPCAETRSVASEGPSQRERARESERREGGGVGEKDKEAEGLRLAEPSATSAQSFRGPWSSTSSARLLSPGLPAAKRLSAPLRSGRGGDGPSGPQSAPAPLASEASERCCESGFHPLLGSRGEGQCLRRRQRQRQRRRLRKSTGTPPCYSRSLAATQRQDLRGSWSYGDTRTA